jgi:hypothetical protein
MTAHKSFEESLRSGTIPPSLQEYINHLTILIHGPPEVVLLAIDLHEDLTDEEGVTVASMFSL